MANIKTDKYFSRDIAEGISDYIKDSFSNVKDSVKFTITEIGEEHIVEVSYDIDFINTLLYVTFNAGIKKEGIKHRERENKDTV